MKSYTRLQYNFLSDVRNGLTISTEDLMLKTQKQETCSVPCGRINAFFRTWLIYSCKGRCCPYSKKCSNNSYTPKTLTTIEFAFYTLLGADYTDATIRNIIRRLNRIRHIITDEGNNFESIYNDYTDKDGNVFKAILSKNENSFIKIQYKRIFDFYNEIFYHSNQELTETFVNEIKTAVLFYDQIDKNKGNVTDYVTREFFFSNNDLIYIRSKALVAFYELLWRFFDMIDIDLYKGHSIPDSDYITNFFYTEKVFVTQDFIFILLNNHKNLVVYDINDKMKSLTENDKTYYQGQRLEYLNKIRGIYLLKFDKKITEITEDHYNALIKLEDGSYLINGSNLNHKIDSSDSEVYFFFHKFAISSIHEIIVKNIITKNFVIQQNSSGKIYVHGDPIEDSGFYASSLKEISDGIRVYEPETVHEDFYISENEKYIYTSNIKENDDSIHMCDDGSFISFNENVLEIVSNNNEEKTSLTIAPNEGKSLEIIKLISLRKDGLLVECSETDGENKEYRYFTYGDNSESRLGYLYNEETLEEDKNKLHEITNDILIDENNEINKSLRIEKVISYSKRVLILNSGNVLTASGKNDGFFCEATPNNEEENNYNKFTRIVSNSDITPIYDICATTDKSDKPVVLLYNNYRVYAFGSVYFRGFKNGGGYLEKDSDVILKNSDTSLYRITGPNCFSLFCTQRGMYSENPAFDLVSNAFANVSSESKIGDFNCEKVKETLNYMKDIIIREENYDSFDIKIRNIEDTSDYIRNLRTNPISGKISNYKTEDFSNYITNRYLLKEYINSIDYSYFAMFMNLIVMMAESKNYLRLIEVNEKGTMSKSEFEIMMRDINCELPYDKEDRINGYTKTIS